VSRSCWRFAAGIIWRRVYGESVSISSDPFIAIIINDKNNNTVIRPRLGPPLQPFPSGEDEVKLCVSATLYSVLLGLRVSFIFSTRFLCYLSFHIFK
jgi:hypothetical protein